jgi:serine-protein kinase ATM
MRKYSANQIKCDLKEAQLFYSKLDLKRAKFLLKNSIENFETQLVLCERQQNQERTFNNKGVLLKNLNHFISALDFYSNLLDETKSENPTVIINQYLEKSIYYIKKYESVINRARISNTYLQFGKFSDMQYQNITEFLNSTSFEEHRELMKKLQAEKLRVQVVEPTNYLKTLIGKQHDIDQEEIKQMLNDQENYLCKAIENYLEYLRFGEDFIDSNQTQPENLKEESNYKSQQQVFATFRLVSLWTQNIKNIKVNQTIKQKIFEISTYKFCILMHQLSARMSLKSLSNSPKTHGLKNVNNNTIAHNENDADSLFQSILIELIINLAKDHPHHVLPLIFAFSNSHKDYLITSNNAQHFTAAKNTGGSRTKKSHKSSEDSDENDLKNFLMTEDRVNTANYILNILKQKNEKLCTMIDSMSLLCEAYIELANTPFPKQTKTGASDTSITFPKNLIINKIKNFNLVNVFTSSIPISCTGEYDEKRLAYISKFETTFKLANGVNLPKIVVCLGTDGNRWKQLVKGHDDLRQDAVMQQFFSTVNELIKINNAQVVNKLNEIRTYKIVPLSQKSGVLGI